MKKIMIMCGTGVATSTVAVNRIRTWLEEKGMEGQVKILQARILDQIDKLDAYDVVISTAVLPDVGNEKIISGLPLLTGQGLDEFYEQVERSLNTEKEE